MKRRNTLILPFIIIALLASSCVLTPKKTPSTNTVVPDPTSEAIVQPTAVTASKTFAPIDAATPVVKSTEPAPTPEPGGWDELDVEFDFKVYQGGYRVRAPFNAHVMVQANSTELYFKEANAVIYLTGAVGLDNLPSELGIYNEKVSGLLRRHGVTGESRESDYTVADWNGKWFDFSGMDNDIPVMARAVVVKPGEARLLLAVQFSPDDVNPKDWETVHKTVFVQTLEQLEFLYNEDLQDVYTCPISSDSSYGTTPENPIRVGGGMWLGPSSERAYLDNLMDRMGNPLTYERKGSLIGPEGNILDEYVVILDERTYTFYLDEYSFEQPLAPAGFDCFGAFPLGQFEGK